MPPAGSLASARRDADAPWADVRERLHARGLRWTPQRRVLIEVLSRSDGHVTGAELVERCRDLDPATTPSTVYRTLDVLEDLGIVRHAHGADGREEFHVLPDADHGHLHCLGCRESWEIGAGEAAALVAALRADRGFAVELSHLSIAGLCRACAGDA
jgi:Fur family ferric uptake transcriptional regulator